MQRDTRLNDDKSNPPRPMRAIPKSSGQQRDLITRATPSRPILREYEGNGGQVTAMMIS
jgi:hypothetical protein